MKKTDRTHIRRRALRKGLSVVLTMLIASVLVLAYPARAAAAGGTPLREVHKVSVGNTEYCLFVTNNVVLTPGEISALSDDELAAMIVDRAGLYMKTTNCRKSSSKVITAEKWIDTGHCFMLSDEDIADLRGASPSQGKPVKLYMDVLVSTEPADISGGSGDEGSGEDQGGGSGEEPGTGAGSDTGGSGEGNGEGTGEGSGEGAGAEDGGASADDPGADQDGGSGGGDDPAPEEGGGEGSDPAPDDQDQQPDEGGQDEEPIERHVYSTYKLMSPELLFVVVAAESDIDAGEDNCSADNSGSTGKKNKGSGGGSGKGSTGDKGEMLPEYRTIKIEDRKGDPIEETLKEGTPVELSWEEPDDNNTEDKHFLSRIPGALAGLLLLLAALAALIFIFLKRRNRDDGDEEEEEEEEESEGDPDEEGQDGE